HSAAAGVAALGLMLTACSGDGGDGGSPSESPSASEVSTSSGSPNASDPESASPSATASGSYEPATETAPAKNVPVPEMPEAVKEPTEEGLEAAVEYWWETEHFLKATGDSSPMGEVSNDDCIACQDLIEDWTWVYDEGGWAMVDAADIDVRVASVDNVGGTFIFFASEEPGEVFQPDGTRVEGAKSTGSKDIPWTGSATFVEESDVWRIDELLVEGS
uniref:DUF6318 family protein n=1 Tax=Citricoccus sp. TaxID=1978372 RepID=UPI0028BEFDA2